ncbi:MAG: aminotransferase class I/II-fold pyridoxal phosphate-dependent enzyme [Bacillota bacterium]|nr:aminotransferase class I/II-fold pyridoxal phosphate-dependent enzyme [Bacillota bacterium]
MEALLQHVKAGRLPFHTPGHKQGRGLSRRLAALLGRRALAIDLDPPVLAGPSREIPPDKARRQAEELAAALFGAERTFFLVNGTTLGLQASLLALCPPGQAVLLPRYVHRSVIGGLILSGARPVFLPVAYDEEWGLPLGVEPAVLEREGSRHPEARALLLTSPTYYGLTPDLQGAVGFCRARGIPLLVDEAHGAHLGFSPRLPQSALAAGADVVVQSAHKTLGVLTQASLLHVKRGRAAAAKIQEMVALLETSSPSPLLLASLDAACAELAERGKDLVERAVDLAWRARRALEGLPNLRCLGPEVVGKGGVAGFDPTRLVVSVRGLGLTGLQAGAWLAEHCGLQVEMADLENLVLVITAADDRRTVDRLVQGLRRLAEAFKEQKGTGGAHRKWVEPPSPVLAVTPREAALAPMRLLPLAEAAGRICGEVISVYPPGVPVLCPGEVISREMISYLLWAREQGLHLTGSAAGEAGTIICAELDMV